jgi:hypothetical protein
MRSEGKLRKIENQQLVNFSRICTSTTVGFAEGVISKE